MRVAFVRAALRSGRSTRRMRRVRAGCGAATCRPRRSTTRRFPKPFRRAASDRQTRFLERVVPPILAEPPDSPEVASRDDLLAGFLKINGELRPEERASRSPAWRSRRRRRCSGAALPAARQLAGRGAFADHRTYVYKGKDVDQQVHLGFDLAVTTTCRSSRRREQRQRGARRVPRHLRQLRDHRPRHGRAVALRPPVVDRRRRSGDAVEKGRSIGRSGMTGLAGGDHLHFTMLVERPAW